jgi:hypothetical protein
MELFRKLLDLPVLLDVVAPGIVYRASCAAVVATGCLMGALVTSWTMAPTRCCSSGCPDQCLILVASLLLLLLLIIIIIVVVVVVVIVVAAALSSAIHIGLAWLPCLWGRWRMPSRTLYSPGTFVHQAEELGDILHVVRGQLLEHLLVPHTLSKHNYNRSIGDATDGVVNLGEQLDKGAQ